MLEYRFFGITAATDPSIRKIYPIEIKPVKTLDIYQSLIALKLLVEFRNIPDFS